jgi:hypothetical protein
MFQLASVCVAVVAAWNIIATAVAEGPQFSSQSINKYQHVRKQPVEVNLSFANAKACLQNVAPQLKVPNRQSPPSRC